MAAPVPTDMVKDKEYSNWLKVTLALYYMKSGLHTFIRNEIDCLHQSLVQIIYGGNTVLLPPCTVCDAHHVRRNKYSGVWAFSKQCKSYCDVWLDELLVLHSNPKSEQIYWDNSHVASWPFKPWECAKVFMPRGQPPSNVGPAECDAQAILTLLASCQHFHHKLSSQGLVLTRTISTIRNKVMHDSEMKLSDTDRVTYIQQIIQFLEDPVSLKSIDDCKAAVGNIQKIDNDSLDVSFNLDTEMEGLWSAVHEFRLELGVQEKKSLDTVDSLKEEYKQLREQITRRVENLEIRMNIIERNIQSVKEQTDTALQQHKTKHKEMQAAVTHISADVTSYRARLDTVEENVEYIYYRSATNESTLQSVKEQIDTALHLQEKKHEEMHANVTSHKVRLDAVEENVQSLSTQLQEFKTNTDTALQQQEKKHEELMHVSLTSHGVRLDTAEENVNIFGTELQLLKTNTDTALQQQEKKYQDVNTTVTHLSASVTSHEERLAVVEDNMQELKTNILTKGANNSGGKMKVAEEWISDYNTSETPVKRRPETDGLRQLKCQTEDTLDTFRRLECIPTTQTEEAKKLLDKKRHVLIKGNPGEGKTMAALYLINNEIYRDRRVILRCPDDWKMVDTDWVSIVVLEDILGQFDFDPGCLQKWMLYLPTIQEHVDAGKLRVIITIRNDIPLKAYSKLTSVKLFCDDVSLTLSSEKLKQSEKMCILNRELQRHEKSMKQDDKEKCIANFSGFIGFPKCCSLFAEDNVLFSTGPDFFKSPAQYFVENITKLEETRFLSLAFLFCNGEIYEEYLSPETMPKSSKTLLKELSLCLEIKDWKAALKLLKDGYDSRLGLYILKYTSFEFRLGSFVTKPCIRFSHAVVCEAVGLVLGCYPKAIVKYGNSEFLYQKTTAKAKDTTSQNVFIPESEYGILAERMIQDVAEKGHKESVVKHSSLEQDLFVVKLKDELHKGNRIKDFFSDKLQFYRHQDLIEGECITFLQHLLQSDRNVVISVHSQMLEFLACMHKNNRTDCWQCHEKQNLLELALYYHHFEIADKQIAMNACYTYTSLCNAARHGELGRVQSILETLTRSRIFSPECGVAKDALCRAYISRNQDVIDFLLKEGITLDERHLIYVVKQGNMNDLMLVIEHLKCHNNWNPHLEKYWRRRYFFSPSQYLGKVEPCEVGTFPYSIALYIAYCNEEFDVACHLQINGITVSMEMLPGVLRYSSKEAVSRLIQTLQERGIWDSNHCDAVAALQIGYTQQKYDVCNLLIQFGVLLTMKSVPDVIIHQRAPFAKRVIQHMKNTNSWEPGCHYASVALEYAYIQGAYDVCDLLVQEGVSMTMKHLPLMILRSFEYVKTAVTQWKDSTCWDPKCDYAAIALEHAYSERKYDVCDLLIQEGVSLTMKHLPLVTLHPFENVKTAVTQLKDSTCWDPKCDYAAIALEHAYSERKYDVCDLLIQEGVSLTMKNLSNIVCHFKASFKFVQKVIEHLKDNDSWDPKSVYAAEALQHAYRRRTCDVCDLLIHEGVLLTMKALPFMASLDCVKKGIQQLQDTGNWDPKCDYASIALQYACRHHNDVCNLLIQQGVPLTMENLPDLICNNEASIQSVKETIKHFKNAKNWNPKCDDASEAFKYAFIKEKYDVCDVLTQEGVSLTMKNLPTVVWVHMKSAEKAVEHLKYTGNWDPRCDDASKSLQYAYIKERYDLCDMLIQEGVSLTMKNLPCKNKSFPSFVSVKKTILHLKDTDNWDPKCDHASEAIATAYAQEKYDVCVLLVQEGVSLAMKNLTFLAQLENVSLVSIKKAIQHIKGTDNWDPKSIHASKALECAYYKQTYGVCDLLVEEGVLLTMQTLPYVVLKVEASTQHVRKAIKQLKDSANWDPNSDYASLALAKAYATKKNDVCDLLLQEGISLKMKNIHNVVCDYNASVESVQKTIQHLKEVKNWDLKYYDSSEALVNNYKKENYDVCDLLVQEGLSLTMKNLPDAICRRKISGELSMKRAQLLNDIVSWAPCDNAYVLLANMHVEEKHDVHSMDVGETESPRMMQLHRVVCIHKKSVESVKKIIQHLKDTGNWDPRCDDASEALAMAYIHAKYDVCDLLVQEGAMITMKNFGSIVLHYETSVDSVKQDIKNLKELANLDSEYVALAILEKKKALFDSFKNLIQQLKDTGNWDPNCDNASLALGIAYVQELYNVCDLLVQEGVSLTMRNLSILGLIVQPSIEAVKKTIEHLKVTDNWDTKCDNASGTLAMAYVLEKYDVCALLVQEGVSLTMRILCIVVQTKTSIESVKKTIQHLKDTDNWNISCDDAYLALATGYIQEKYDVCHLLVKEGVLLTMRILRIVVQNKTSIESVKITIQHLKDIDSWNISCDDASEALATAYIQEKYDVCRLLVQEGVLLTMSNLAIVVEKQISIESVKQTIQLLRDTNNWNIGCDDASVALAVAYIKEKYDVCDLLVQEGVLLTMRILSIVVERQRSIESVKKIIQHLKDTDIWNISCDDASVALTAAYLQEKYDVCDLLVQGGVSLAMRFLRIVVQKERSIESVKKTIQHLKDTDNWNISCDDASVALAAAYIQEKYDVCHLLVQEGVSLTMGNLVIVVEGQTSLDSVKKTIQHLKDTDNWNISCDDAFVALAIAYIKEKYDVCHLLVQEGVSITMRILRIVVQNKTSIESVKKTIQYLKDTDNWNIRCDDASEALANAYIQEKYDVCHLLVQEGVLLTMRTLCIVVQNKKSVESVKETIQHLKDTVNWNISCDDASVALAAAYIQEKYDVCDLLVQEGVSLTMRILRIVVENKTSIESVKKTIQHLKDTDNWNISCDEASLSLAAAYFQEKYDVCHLLVKEGIKLTMRSLSIVAQNKTSIESIKKTIEHLKDTDNWNISCDDASVALSAAYIQEKYDVCDLLVQEGVSLTMRILSIVVENQTSIESVKKIIQYLKDTDNWNISCDDASEALANAYIEEKYDVCHLLVQEGVLLTMRILSIVVQNKKSVESVKETIQHLKDTENWNISCDDASVALAAAYIQEKYDVCDLLVQEGVSLTMRILRIVVENKTSIESVKKTIQHLKDTDNWNISCDDASLALAAAYFQEKYDVCHLLVQEGVSITMRILRIVVENKTSIESAKKTVQHLKDTDNWNISCDDASLALAAAYVQEKYDVCHLLVQEGILLTMRILSIVVQNKTSIESIKKTIEHLKDTDNWNISCDDASVALSAAYIQEKYDVCHLLVQEGVSLTMRILSIVVENQTSIESVKKIIQHLKDTDSWNISCDDASLALAAAYIQEKYDVCHLLVQEGISLAMRFLRIVVQNKRSIDSVKKTIQHLKDTDIWNISCDDASVALTAAYIEEKDDVCDLLVQEGVSLAMRVLRIVVHNKTSIESVKKTIQHLKDTDNWNISCDDASVALTAAYIEEKYDVCHLLVQEGVLLTMRILRIVVQNKTSIESVKKTIQHLKDTDNWNISCDDASEALANAYNQEKYDVCHLLVQEGVLLTMRILRIVVQNKRSIESVKKTIQHLKDTDNWNISCDDASVALATAYIQEKYDVCHLLVQEGVLLTMRILSIVVENKTSIESVKKTIQHLKDTDNWNIKSDAASVALATAYIEQKYDIYDLLVQEGVSLTMMILGIVVESKTSVESVKKTIQHLKDTDHWNTGCDDASAALAVAYIEEKYDVCHLLVQEGVSLTMRILSIVVQKQISIESVKQTIQDLKDTGNWNISCDDASEALAAAYFQEKHDVYHLLVQEGVLLTMRILSIVVQKQTSIESVKKTIQHLKDTDNWNISCADASVALAAAYIEEKYDMCHLLVQEGVSLAMRFLRIVLEKQTSIESVKKTIEHLKDTGNWNISCDDAFVALATEYIQQKYDVCDLLVLEGVSLTMRILRIVVEKQTSIESVKKTVQDLKDTDNWNISCDEASIALATAYIQEKYDVCDLLVQEGVSLTMGILCSIVQYKTSVESVKKIIQHLKDTDNWNIGCDAASVALAIAYNEKKYDVCHLLVKEGVLLTMRILRIVVQNKTSIDSVKRTIQHLKDTDNWNISCDDASLALATAYIQEKYDVCRLLVQEGVLLTMSDLAIVVEKQISIESVKQTIQLLRDTNNWNIGCDDASVALATAYIQEKYDVYHLLVQEGVLLTMRILSIVVQKQTSIESVKKTIQHLKDTDNWNISCTDASVALAAAYIEEKYDMCHLLVQEGVSLAMRFLRIVLEKQTSIESVKKTIEHLKDTGNWNISCDDAFVALATEYIQQKYDVCDLLVLEGVSLTMRILRIVVEKQTSIESVKKTVQDLKDTDNWNISCDEASIALATAYIQEKYDVCDLLVQEGVSLTMGILCSIVQYKTSVESVKKIIQHLKDTDNWNIGCDAASVALAIAYNEKKYDVCHLLVKEGVLLTMRILRIVVQNKTSIDSVKKTIQHLKDTDNWNISCDDASLALATAYIQEKYDVCRLLVQEGVLLTMSNLAIVVEKQISIESVKQIIQLLRDTNNWNIGCDDASVALATAYIQEKYDVCQLLIQEGVSLTMRILRIVVQNKTPVKSVKKTIQDLKDTENWNISCDDASLALAAAYFQEKYDVCHLLIQEGVSLAMRFLRIVVEKQTSIESVRKAMQHLKDTGNWNIGCDDASEALESAYIQQKYDVCDLLDQEGVSLTMRILRIVVQNKTSVESIRVTIQHLKDSDNWNVRCDDASVALATAYIQEKYDVCDLLVHEGVSLTMRILSIVVESKTSIESVRKSVQHLKDTDNWNISCDDASVALATAYIEQKYDVCHLLVQEGVSLTMGNLAIVVEKQTSIETVKKTIQHLKDTDNWNISCDDASVALATAYIEEKYDVCHLLVHGGVSLTMGNLSSIVQNKTSIETIKKTIQHLKDTDNWNINCDDASVALATAYIEEKYDVCHLLVQEGVSLRMRILSIVVHHRTSVESVMKIIQHLKYADSWDPKCEHALLALSNAYVLKKHYICDLLVQEGVELTMRNFAFVVANKASIQSVRKAMQHLKDIGNWNPSFDGAIMTLLIPPFQKRFDVFGELVDEGVGVRPFCKATKDYEDS